MTKSNNTKKKNNTKEKEHYQIKRKQIQKKNNHHTRTDGLATPERITDVTVDLEGRESGSPKMALTVGPSFPRDVSSSTLPCSVEEVVLHVLVQLCVLESVTDKGQVQFTRAPPPDPHRPAYKTRLRSSDQSKQAPADFPSSSSKVLMLFEQLNCGCGLWHLYKDFLLKWIWSVFNLTPNTGLDPSSSGLVSFSPLRVYDSHCNVHVTSLPSLGWRWEQSAVRKDSHW